jgi:HD superfamily phosphodiesterase
MIDEKLIADTENYVREVMEQQESVLSIAHDFKHVDRVRNWALLIAEGENYDEPGIVEITALLHDIGLAKVDSGGEKTGFVHLPPHDPLGAEMAGKYLTENTGLGEEVIGLITDAIRHHSVPPKIAEEHLAALGEKGALLKILRDADNLDALGAAGLMRAFTSKHFLPEYDPQNIKGEGWDLSSEDFREKFGFDSKEGLAPVRTIIDQVNQQIRYFDENLHTFTARKLAKPLVRFTKTFVIHLENEIEHRKMS